MTTGRSPDADLSLPHDEEVSRYHAELQAIGRTWAIVDDGMSTNGTFVNGERIRGRRPLADRDAIRVGQTTLIYRHPAEVVTERTKTAAKSLTIDQLPPTQRRVLVALCRPFKHSDSYVTPATNQQIADELFMSLPAVKTHLHALYERLDLEHLPES